MNDKQNPHTATVKDSRLLGTDLLQALASLLGTARIYQENNRLLIQCVEKFLAILDRLMLEEDEVSLVANNGRFYLQQEKMVYRRNMTLVIDKMLRFFEERNLDGLCFYADIRFTPLSSIVLFARLLDAAVKEDDPLLFLKGKFSSSTFSWIEIIDGGESASLESFFADSIAGPDESGGNNAGRKAATTGSAATGSGEKKRRSAGTGRHSPPGGEGGLAALPGIRRRRDSRKKKALRTYGYALNSLQEVAGKLATSKRAGIGKAIHLIQNMVDLIMEDDHVLLGLSTIRDYDDYTFTHSVNVAILSLCLGQRIGLSRISLERLGLSGLFHDLGKIDVPNEILNKPSKLEEWEFQEIQKHSLNSTRRIIRLRASYDKKAKIMLAPFEHHLNYDLSGYPKTPRRKPLSLFGRIVCIADVYDAITSPRIYRKTSMSQDQALGMMLKDSGKAFDPLLLKVFINMLGVYPVGTVLILDDNEMGIVAGYSSEKNESNDLLLLLLEPDGKGGYTKGDTINLGSWNPENGSFNRPIIESRHPADLGIQPAAFFHR